MITMEMGSTIMYKMVTTIGRARAQDNDNYALRENII